MTDISRHLFLTCMLTLFSFPVVADMVETIAQVKLSVVMVGTYRKTDSPPLMLRGTGFVVGDGLTVATNAHVIGDVNSGEPAALIVQVSSAVRDQRMRSARIWVVDDAHDLALLKIDGPVLPRVTLRDSNTVKEGLAVAFTGFPIGGALGFSPVTHRGMVSAVTPMALPSANARQLKENVIRRLKSGSFDIFQLDATAYPGNSGGPLFDVETGEVVGIVNMGLVKGTKEAALSQPSGISYAIPSNFLRDLLENGRSD
jgi:serine protease Do